jgi:hypothetical protein
MSSHTPGPWRAFFCVNNQRLKIGDWCFVTDNGHSPVAIRGVKVTNASAAADARLMAAAPELLAALRLCANRLSEWVEEEDVDDIAAIRAAATAVERATGVRP